jgi:hypothetical protein
MARDRGGISEIPDGAGSDSERSTADGRERGPCHRAEARLYLPSTEARAYSAVADVDTSLMPQAPSTGGHPSQHLSKHGSSSILVREGSPGRAPAETRGSKPRGKLYKHYYATIPARRTWPKGHRYHGRSEEAQRNGGERYHPDRRPELPH